MTPRETRKQRREAERQARKAEIRTQLESRRAEINRANAHFSSGPSTPEGKAKSSQNACKHGLYSKHLVMRGEDPAELDRLKADLHAEHQPANQTEAILVNELAEQFWRIRRMRRLEAEAFTPEKLDDWCSSGLLTHIQRIMAAAERGFHKALNTLGQLQSARGFVPQNSQMHAETQPQPEMQTKKESDTLAPEPEIGFVRQIHTTDPPSSPDDPPVLKHFSPSMIPTPPRVPLKTACEPTEAVPINYGPHASQPIA